MKTLHQYFEAALTYSDFRGQIDQLLLEGKTTGDDHSEFYINYTKLNVQRMRRLDKTTVVSNSFASIKNKVSSNLKWLVITEGWCGDSSQILPVINKIAIYFNIELRIVLRDQNLDLMDQYLTNGTRGIPKLLIMDDTPNLVIAQYGPRPALAQDLINQLKQVHGVIDKQKMQEQLHAWYASNKTEAIQSEIFEVMNRLVNSISN
ncbi:MAG: hypothetical protein RIQ89_1911 [Bacteroidota bacterium]|jgi:hypothetical protein